ncbi:MAG: HlyD family secretion protein [Thiohalocapsa sp.]
MSDASTSWQALQTGVRFLVTLVMVALAAGAVYWVWQQRQAHPWTRDGQVLARVVKVAPRVAGPVLAVHVTDNQLVAEGDPLFELDPALFQQALAQAKADLAQIKAEATDADADAARAKALLERQDLSQQDYDAKVAQQRSKRAAVQSAEVALDIAALKLGYTAVAAPVAGFVTNLTLDIGSWAGAGEPRLALIDAASFWVAGYFKETDLRSIQPGDPAAVRLMAYPNRTLTGRVQSIAFGIEQRNAALDIGGLTDVSPTFEWIRLAQRVPVHIRLDPPPSDVALRLGLTASVGVNPLPDAGR